MNGPDFNEKLADQPLNGSAQAMFPDVAMLKFVFRKGLKRLRTLPRPRLELPAPPSMKLPYLHLLPILCASVLSLGAAPGEVWHEPALDHPDLASATMRTPLYEAADNDLTVYQGFFKDNGNNGDQTGGALVYRSIPRGGSPTAWTEIPLGFHADVGANQFWEATLPSSGIGPTDVIEYYIRVNFDGTTGNPVPETTYLHGGDLQGNFETTTSESAAQAAPYSIRNRPGWIFHANNRTEAGEDIQLRVKTGYIGPENAPSTLWASDGAVYYTTDGSEPSGSLGTPSGTTSVAPLAFDGTQRDFSGNGNAAWWEATLENVLAGLNLGDEVRYRIGLWNSATNEEKFADHFAADETTFVFRNGQVGDPELTVNGTNANYTTTKVFVDEIAGDSVNLNIVFRPGQPDVTDAEIYTNLNRRDRANEDADGDGYDDGISGLDGNALTAGDNGHYYKAYDMTDAGGGTYTLTLPAEKTGAYRLTARWKVQGDPSWRWYTNQAANRRDHAITVSPKDARDIILYEINVHNIEATGDTFAQRSTIEDMHNAPGAPHNGNNRWDLDYLKGLGANWLWFQPVHPPARDGREPEGGYGTGSQPYEPGSPYAVKNFFQISPIMTKDFSGDHTNNADLLDATNRAAAMSAWQDFVTAADNKDVGIMLDAAFNHTAFDVEFGTVGIDLLEPDDASWNATDEIRVREARLVSEEGDYGDRASSDANIAAAPDRFDFGKWRDVKDVFFGRYDALVEEDAPPERSSYTSEGDWFDRTDSDWTNNDFVKDGQNKNVTKQVWKFFATYAPYWLGKTRPAGENRNSATEPGLTTAERYAWDERGIDGLRCDFGQGLPPRAWEYITNVAREHKWNFVMMSESLDGGAVTYRSNRHFDILNENIVFPLKSANSDDAYRSIFEDRRNAYGQGVVLINSVSHDEENYEDPWEALIRFSVASTMDGVPMIFPGQELGISRDDGYDHYEINFGKKIPHFNRFNSMAPIWNDTDFGNDQLYPVYAGMGDARQESPALRSPNRWFLDGDGNNPNIHAVAKYEETGASPATSDVVLAFANLDRNNTQQDNFKIPGALAPLLGLKDGRDYNVRNLAAYEAQDATRGEQWLWDNENGYTGSELKSNGFFVSLNKVPDTSDNPATPGVNEAAQAWADAPFEAQYLRVYDITAPTAAPGQPDTPNVYAYEIGDSVRFDWDDVPADSEGVVPDYEVSITVNGSPSGTFVTDDSHYTVDASEGDSVSLSVKAVNPHISANSGPSGTASQSVKLLPPDGDEDADGMSNADEDTAGTNPLDNASRLAIRNTGIDASDRFTLEWPSVNGVNYRVQSREALDSGSWNGEAFGIAGDGGMLQWTDPEATGTPPEGRKFYRVIVE